MAHKNSIPSLIFRDLKFIQFKRNIYDLHRLHRDLNDLNNYNLNTPKENKNRTDVYSIDKKD